MVYIRQVDTGQNRSWPLSMKVDTSTKSLGNICQNRAHCATFVLSEQSLSTLCSLCAVHEFTVTFHQLLLVYVATLVTSGIESGREINPAT